MPADFIFAVMSEGLFFCHGSKFHSAIQTIGTLQYIGIYGIYLRILKAAQHKVTHQVIIFFYDFILPFEKRICAVAAYLCMDIVQGFT